MDTGALDNPIWQSLTGAHAALARRAGDALWYGAAHAPFLAVQSTAARVQDDPGLAGRRYFLGVAPQVMPPRWRPVPLERYHAPPETLQLFRGLDEPALSDREYAVRVLGPEHRESMLALTGLVYPEFFRARTAELGTYLGILREGRVVAMAGERLAVTGAREISAVCTHPNFTGQGMASALLSALVKRHHEAGLASFLHVSANNPQARRLYERLGFTARAILKLTAVEIGG